MSAHFLLNLLNELRKSDKMRGLPSILFIFRNEFIDFNAWRYFILIDRLYKGTITLLVHRNANM